MSFLFNIFGGTQNVEDESSEEVDNSQDDEEQNFVKKTQSKTLGSSSTNDRMPNPKRHKKNFGNGTDLFIKELKEHPMSCTQAPMEPTQDQSVKMYRRKLGVGEPCINNTMATQSFEYYKGLMTPAREQLHSPKNNFMENSNAFPPRLIQQERNALYLSPPRFSREAEQRQHFYDSRLSNPDRLQKVALNPYPYTPYEQNNDYSDTPIHTKMKGTNYHVLNRMASSPYSKSIKEVYYKNPVWSAKDKDNESDESNDFVSSSQASLDSEEQIDKENTCAFCKFGKGYQTQVLGPYSKVGSSRKHYVHETCARWCPDLKDFSQSTLYPPPRKFNVLLIKAIKRSSGLKCAYCRKKGAAIGCIDHKCKHSYHLNCAQKDGATFILAQNFLQKQKILSFLHGIYCRDCSPFQQNAQSSPHNPLNIYQMLRENQFSSGETKEMARTLLIVDKVLGERETKKKKEVELTFFGANFSQWFQVENVPSSLLLTFNSKKKKSPLCNATSEEDSNEEENGDEEDEHLKSTDEEVCDVCKGAKSSKKNPIIFCEGKRCNVKVHKRCYGIAIVPKGKWMCYRCSAQAPLNLKCSRCNSSKASQAMTCKFGEWIHVTCLNDSLKFQVAKGTSFSSVKNRRALQMARITPRDRQDIWEIILREETHVKCPVCRINHIKKEGSFQCAHIDASAKGRGRTAQEEIWNIVPSCAKCNLTCNTKNLIDFMDDSIMMRPHIKPLLFLKVKSIIRSQMDCCPLSTKEILSEKDFTTVVAKLYSPKKMRTIARLLELSSDEHHNMFVEPDEPAPLHFYKKFLSK
jgi:hypothetical protein